MSFQLFAICVEFHLPQAVFYERGMNCPSTLTRVFPTKIDVDSVFTCQAALHRRFRVIHLCERTLKFMNVCIQASLGTAFPRSAVAYTSVLHESDDVSVFVTKCPTDQKSGLFVIADLATNKNSFPNPTALLGALSPVCAYMWRDFCCSSVTPVHIILYQEVQNPFSMSHCPPCN